jgi:ribosomal protein L3
MKKPTTQKGLYANINAKKKRIAAGSGEKMRKVGSKGEKEEPQNIVWTRSVREDTPDWAKKILNNL